MPAPRAHTSPTTRSAPHATKNRLEFSGEGEPEAMGEGAGCDPPEVCLPWCVTTRARHSGRVTSIANNRSSVTMQQLVLSLFPGIDLLGRGFEAEGFSVVRGPDLIFGGDIREFHVPSHRFDGIIGGSPCQDFSRKRRTPPTGYGLEMLREFERVIEEAAPCWWLLENVPGVPDVAIAGYSVQRFDLRATECGLKQLRLRHFQFGSRDGLALVVERQERQEATVPTALASEGGQRERRAWGDFCELQGLPRDFSLPSFTQGARYKAVGNGVPLPMSRAVARAIKEALTRTGPAPRLCICGCARRVTGNQQAATAACRKRMQRRRDTAIA